LFFQGENKLSLFQTGPYSKVEETDLSLEETHLYKEQYQLAHYFPVRIELVLKVLLPANCTFHDGERLNLLQIGLFRRVKKPMYLSRGNHLVISCHLYHISKRNTSCNLGFSRWS
jgi:hypothetical protein